MTSEERKAYEKLALEIKAKKEKEKAAEIQPALINLPLPCELVAVPAAPAASDNQYKLDTVSARELQLKDMPDLFFAVEEIMPQGLSILSAPSKYGKSFLSLDMSCKIATGSEFFGFKTSKSGVLYLALEDSMRRLKDRLGYILDGADAPENIYLATAAKAIDCGLNFQINSHMKDHPDTKLVIIDIFERVRSSSTRFSSAYAMDYKDMVALKTIADERGICVLVIHHNRKAVDISDVYNSISGTNGLMGAADTIWIMQRDNRDDTQTKLHMIGRDVEARCLVLEISGCKWRVVGTEEEESERKAFEAYNNDPVVRTIRALLKESPSGINISTGDFFIEMNNKVGDYGGFTPRKLGKHFISIANLLLKYDGIIHYNGRHGVSRSHRFIYKRMDMPLLTEAALMSETSLTSLISEMPSTPGTPIKPEEPSTTEETYMSEESFASLAMLTPPDITETQPDMIEFIL